MHGWEAVAINAAVKGKSSPEKMQESVYEEVGWPLAMIRGTYLKYRKNMDSILESEAHYPALYLDEDIIAGAQREAAAWPGLVEFGKTPNMAQGWLSTRLSAGRSVITGSIGEKWLRITTKTISLPFI